MMSIDAKLVSLAITCIIFGSNYQLFLFSQAARFLDESTPPTGDGHSKIKAKPDDPQRAGSWKGNTTSPTGTILTPPPALTTKYSYESKTYTANSPGSSSTSTSSVLVKTVTPAGRPSPSVTTAISPTSAYVSIQAWPTVPDPGVGSPENNSP